MAISVIDMHRFAVNIDLLVYVYYFCIFGTDCYFF